MKNLMKVVHGLLEAIVAFAIGSISLAVILQVFFRFILNNPLSWPEEFARIVFIFLVFIGGALASVRGSHISIDLIEIFNLPEGIVKILDIIRNLLIGLVMYATFYGSIKIISVSLSIRLPATNFPMSIMVVPVTIGAFLMLFWCAVSLIKTFISFSKIEN